MITHYTAITLISAFAMLIMVFCAQSNQFLNTYRKRCFQILFVLIMLTGLAEWLAASMEGLPAEYRTLRTAAKFTELLLTPFVPFLAMMAISGKRTTTWKIIPVAANGVLQIVSLFTGWVFTVDAVNVYSHGPLYNLYVALFILETIAMLLHCAQFGRQYQYANITYLILINLLALLAMLMEFYAPYLRLDWTCVSYAAIMFYIYYAQLVEQVDALTGLLNRRSFDCAIRQLKKSANIIFFDVDHFKAVNDAYGHNFGDACLISVAQEIRAVFEKHGYCYRYGGDEFCVILRKMSYDTDALISAYIARIRALREREPRIPFVSAGYAIFDSENETIEEAVIRADEMMYRFKQQHRENT